ncbi:sensor histidine kinase [Psychromicrobium xiongbiense]|uniref:sensor histidine kinase n=1 Tax=Psychromicrobium xiongbiense TaxID=3051184 RepID=UPI0025534A93|nr:histidine kinase [Psychromicrobium sp. YIM S02556]
MSRHDPVRATEDRANAVTVALTEFTTKRRGPIRRFFYEHSLAMDAVVALIYLLLMGATAVVDATQGNWLMVVVVVGTAAALMFRRRYPRIVLGIVVALEILNAVAGYSGNVGLGVLFALYAVAAAYGGRIGFLSAAVASLPLIAVMILVEPHRSDAANNSPMSAQVFWLVAAGFLVLGNVIATGIGVSVWRDRHHELELRAWAQRNAQLASAHERNRIAREMHDVIAHSLSVMIALSDGARLAMERSPEKAGQALDNVSQTGRRALADMQRMLGVLRREGTEEQDQRKPMPGELDVESLLDGFRQAGMPLSFATSGPPLPADPAFRLAVYRIMQESLTNVLRYARGVSRVDALIAHEHPEVTLKISDDGRPPSAASSKGSLEILGNGIPGSGKGLIGMSERAAAYGGRVSAGPQPQGGWLVTASLHCPDASEESQDVPEVAVPETLVPDSPFPSARFPSALVPERTAARDTAALKASKGTP